MIQLGPKAMTVVFIQVFFVYCLKAANLNHRVGFLTMFSASVSVIFVLLLPVLLVEFVCLLTA